MPVTRNASLRKPSQGVRGNDNVPSTPTPPRRRPQVGRTRFATPQPSAQGDVDNTLNLAISSSEEEEEEIPPEQPIELDLELCTVADNLPKTVATLGAGSIPMAAWKQPNNEIDVNKVEDELGLIGHQTSSYANVWCTANTLGWDTFNSSFLRAEISHQSMGRNPYITDLSLSDPSTYKWIYTKVKAFEANNKRSIRVRVTRHGVVAKIVPSPPVSTPALATLPAPRNEGERTNLPSRRQDLAGDAAPSQSQARKRSRPDTVAERRRRNEDIERDVNEATGNYHGSILAHWKCHDKGCKNYSNVCLIVPGYKRHLWLDTTDIRRWSREIRDGKADAKTAPKFLKDEWILRQQDRVDTARSQRGKKFKVSGVEGVSQTFVINTGYSPAAVAAAAPTIRSSPPAVNFGTGLTYLEDYLQWLDREGKTPSRFLQAARVGLDEGGWSYQTLRRVSAQQWLAMGVPDGAQIAIRESMSEFDTWYTRSKLNSGRSSDEDVPARLPVVGNTETRSTSSIDVVDGGDEAEEDENEVGEL